MTDWSFDMGSAPRDGRRVLTVTLADGAPRVVVSRWLPPQKDRPDGRWEMYSAAHPPYAWAPFPNDPPTPPRLRTLADLSVFD